MILCANALRWRARQKCRSGFLSLLGTGADADKKMFNFLGDTIAYSGYRKMINRKIEFPNKVITFDIVSQGNPSVIVFIWDSFSNTSTLIKEYHPGTNEYLYGTVAGMYEDKKHSSPLQAAQVDR